MCCLAPPWCGIPWIDPKTRRRVPSHGGSMTGLRRSSTSGAAAGGHREGVDQVVHAVARVALHPAEGDVAAVDVQADERLPQVAVGHRLPGGRRPAALEPALPPAVAEAVHHVRRVAHHQQRARVGADRLEGGADFHPLVGAGVLATGGERRLVQRPGPAAWTGVARAGAVGPDPDGAVRDEHRRGAGLARASHASRRIGWGHSGTLAATSVAPMTAIEGVSQTFDPDAWDDVAGFEDLTDLTYHRAHAHGTVRIAFDRPDVLNAFRPHTVDELLRVLEHARTSSDVGCVLLTGNGPSERSGKWAFCTGGDQRIRGRAGYQYAS